MWVIALLGIVVGSLVGCAPYDYNVHPYNPYQPMNYYNSSPYETFFNPFPMIIPSYREHPHHEEHHHDERNHDHHDHKDRDHKDHEHGGR